MFYEKKIKYLDYLVKDERYGNAGFIKLEARDTVCNLTIHVNGLKSTDCLRTKIYLIGGGQEKELCPLEVSQGKGMVRLPDESLQNLGNTGISYDSLEAVRIPISTERDIYGILWEKRERPAKITAAPTEKKERPEDTANRLESKASADLIGRMEDRITADAKSRKEDRLSVNEQDIQKESRWQEQKRKGWSCVSFSEIETELLEKKNEGEEAFWQKGKPESISGERKQEEAEVWRQEETESLIRERYLEEEAESLIGERKQEEAEVWRQEEAESLSGERKQEEAEVWRQEEMEGLIRERYPEEEEPWEKEEEAGSLSGERKQEEAEVWRQEEMESLIRERYPEEEEPWEKEEEAGSLSGERKKQEGECRQKGQTESLSDERNPEKEQVWKQVGQEMSKGGTVKAEYMEHAAVYSNAETPGTANWEKRVQEPFSQRAGVRESGNSEAVNREMENRKMAERERENHRTRNGRTEQEEAGRAKPAENKKIPLYDNKWKQLWTIYPHITPFDDDREFLSVGPNDFVILPQKYYGLVNNSFLLHGYYNYKHLVLKRMEFHGEVRYYIGVPGNFFDREKQVAVMFGFESFECLEEPAGTGDYGYYLMRIEL